MSRNTLKAGIVSLSLWAMVGVGCRSDNAEPLDDAGTKLDPATLTDGGSQISGDGGDVTSGPATAATIYDINSEKVKEGTVVLLQEVIVTAVDGYGQFTGDIFVQESKGGPGSGIKLFRAERTDGGKLDEVKAGDHVKIEGTVKYFTPTKPFNDLKHPNKKHIVELERVKLVRLGPGEPVVPADISVRELTAPETALGWEHVLVRVKANVLTDVDAKYGQFKVGGGLEVDDEFYPLVPKVGDCLSITGISLYFYGYRLNPRDAQDAEPATACESTTEQPGPATSVSIKDIQDESSAKHPKSGEKVSVSGVISAVDAQKNAAGKYYGFWVQDEVGGPFSGIFVYLVWADDAANKPVIGQKVTVVGTYKEFATTKNDTELLSEITDASFTVNGTSTAPLVAEAVKAEEIATGGVAAEKYEGVLVKVDNVKAEGLIKKGDKVMGVQLAGSKLIVDAELFDFVAGDSALKSYSSITGVLHYSFGSFRLLPRSAADVVVDQ